MNMARRKLQSTTEIVPTPKLPEVIPEPTTRVRTEGTDWKRAFVVLALQVGSGFIDSGTLSRYIEAVRRECGDEAAALALKIFNGTRSQWMQDFMG
jgi:hypothetical protein